MVVPQVQVAQAEDDFILLIVIIDISSQNHGLLQLAYRQLMKWAKETGILVHWYLHQHVLKATKRGRFSDESINEPDCALRFMIYME